MVRWLKAAVRRTRSQCMWRPSPALLYVAQCLPGRADNGRQYVDVRSAGAIRAGAINEATLSSLDEVISASRQPRRGSDLSAPRQASATGAMLHCCTWPARWATDQIGVMRGIPAKWALRLSSTSCPMAERVSNVALP